MYVTHYSTTEKTVSTKLLRNGKTNFCLVQWHLVISLFLFTFTGGGVEDSDANGRRCPG